MDEVLSLLTALWLTVKPFAVYIVGLLVILFVASSFLRRKKADRSGPEQVKVHHKAAADELRLFNDLSYQRRPLMTEAEINFFLKLQLAFPGYFIFPQIGASALIDIKSQPFNRYHFFAALNWIDTARLDFTLCDPNGQIVALIELDDSSRDTKEDRDEARNYIYRAAGYLLFRFDCRRMPEAAQIRETIIQGSR